MSSGVPSPHSSPQFDQLRILIHKTSEVWDKTWALELLERIEEQYEHVSDKLLEREGDVDVRNERILELKEQLQSALETSYRWQEEAIAAGNELNEAKEQLESAAAQIRGLHAYAASQAGSPCVCEWCSSTPATKVAPGVGRLVHDEPARGDGTQAGSDVPDPAKERS